MDRVRILMAEDNPDHQCLLVMALTQGRPHVEVSVVSTGAALMEKVRQAGPAGFDCLVLDFNLPDCQSADLLRELMRATDGRPAIVISASPAQSVVIQSLRNGSVDFVPKTEAVEGTTLWNRIELAMGDYRRRQAERRRIVRRHQTLAELAEKDPLTGLYNRRSVDRMLRGRGKTFDRRGHSTILMVDIDNFKLVNDAHGHLVGDKVLAGVAEILRNRAGEKDLVCRWGGEEFLIISCGTPQGLALLWAEHVRREIADLAVPADNETVGVTVSVGLASVKSTQLGVGSIEQADEAMYLAKRSGRNRTCTWTMVQFDKATERINRLGRLPPARALRDVLLLCREQLGRTQYDHLTEHAEYVSKMAVRIGCAMGLDETSIERLRTAGLCHDLGKLLVPEDVLAKPSVLSTEERQLVSHHPEVGSVMGMRLGVDVETAGYIRYHHHYYGDGNSDEEPTGDAIPLGARILAVADAFVTMTSERPYRQARSLTAAVSELRRNRGTQFDPAVVDAVPGSLLAEVPVGAL